MTGEVQTLSSQNDELKQEVETVTEERDGLKQEVETLSKEKDGLKHKVETLSKVNNVLECFDKRMEEKVAILQERLRLLEEENAVERQQNQLRKETVAFKNCETVALEEENTQLKNRCREKDITIREVVSENREMKLALFTANITLDEKNLRIRELEENLCETRCKLKHLQDQTWSKCPCCKVVSTVKKLW